jgi:hypothetical protein
VAKRTFCADATPRCTRIFAFAFTAATVRCVASSENPINVQDQSRYVWNLVDIRSGESFVLGPEEPSFHTQARAVHHMSVERSSVRHMRRPYRAMPSRPMRAQIRLVLRPTRVHAFVRFSDFLVSSRLISAATCTGVIPVPFLIPARPVFLSILEGFDRLDLQQTPSAAVHPSAVGTAGRPEMRHHLLGKAMHHVQGLACGLSIAARHQHFVDTQL